MMASDLQRLMRAVKIIAELAWKYRQEDVAMTLLKHCTRREREDVDFIGQFLVDVSDLNRKAEAEAEPRCCECGDSIYNKKDPNRKIAKLLGVCSATIEQDIGQKHSAMRSDARYCSPKCRQRAYRKRATDNRSASGPKRNDAADHDGSHATQAI
jgi:hypothetical protein